ncbi:ABC transporter permease [Phycicoccus sonneratiae]|uniref:ABC transporter permease n=1 Tax=Phycicoccus sonneratiae TaxID=2807628 RepID=A0ABS2CQH9_9MICO|nr:ABC transporter permease [Phycicoccus sonneraticus]MBM6402134.1 ABC transporter permease [Phycicoccus sonneraticus]
MSTTTPDTRSDASAVLVGEHGGRLPAPIPGERPTSGTSFGRLVHVELRKMLDTRAGRWLLIALGVVIAGALTILFVQQGGDHPFGTYLQATTMPMAILLPVVGIMAVTSEWSQRTALVTFTLEARRTRVAWAKVVAALLVGVAAVVFSFALGAAAHAAAIGLRGAEGDWTFTWTALLGAAGYVLLGLLQGLGFGMLLRNTPAAIVLYYVLPTGWSILGSLWSQAEKAGQWLDMNRTMEPLFSGSLTGEQWAQLATSVGVWVALPLTVGMWWITRAEVK